MSDKKILYIGNNTIDTDTQCRSKANLNGIPFKGMPPMIVNEDGAYHASISDIGIDNMWKLVKQFNTVEFLEQDQNIDDSWFVTQTFKNQYTLANTKLINLDKMLFIGCSHTAGIGHTTQETAFPYLVANALGKTHKVLGFPGKGNMLFEEILSTYSLKGASVVVQFSDIFRIRMLDSKSNQPIDKRGYELSRTETEFYTEEYLTYEFLKSVDRIVARLRDAGADFLFCWLSEKYPGYIKTVYQLSKYKEFCWTPTIGVDLANDNEHFGIQSHKLIAELLCNKWTSLYAQN